MDGSHIVYVNGSYKGEDPIGKLMHDFRCKKSKDMHYKKLADGVKHFKEEGGRNMVCEAVEEYAKRKADVAYGVDKEDIVTRLHTEFGVTQKEAEKLYNNYAKFIA